MGNQHITRCLTFQWFEWLELHTANVILGKMKRTFYTSTTPCTSSELSRQNV